MRILQIAPPWFPVPPNGYGGTELVVAGLCNELVDRGHAVTLVAAGGSATRAEQITVYDTPPRADLGDAVVELPHLLEAYRHRDRFDVIHDHTVLGAALASLVDGPPVVHSLHGAWTPQHTRLYAGLVPPLHLVAISDDQVARRPIAVPIVATVNNGIDLEQYPLEVGEEGRLGWLGRAGNDKGADVAVEVARRLGRPLSLAIKINEAEEQRWWDEVLAPRLVGQDVEVVVNADFAQKVRMLGRASVLLFPIRWDEPFGLVMVEANACGTPVVAFDRGSVREVLDPGRTGVVVPPGDVDGLCGAVEAAEHLDREACRAWVAERFTAQRMVDGYLDVYEQALGGTTLDLTAVQEGRRPPEGSLEARS